MKKTFVHRLFVYSLLIAMGMLIGYSLQDKKTLLYNGSEKHIGSSTLGLTNPLLECDLGEEYLSEYSIRPFRSTVGEKINSFVAKEKATHVSYYFRDLNNGSWFGFNEKEEFSPASLMKVPLLMYILKEAEQNPSILETQIEYVRGTDVQQFIPPEQSVEVGKTYSVKQLIEYAIIESDNEAAVLLAQFVGLENFSSIFKDLGLALPPTVEGIGSMSVRDYASFFRILFNASYLSQASSEGALTLLAQTKFKNGLVAGVPQEVLVAHKFGEREFEGQKQLHDCGIVYSGKNPYLLCIMTRGKDFNELAKVIAELSRTTYEEVTSQIKER